MAASTTVIIPCYNAQAFLEEALASLRTQSVPAREIIVVDDGSDSPVIPPGDWVGPPLRIIRTPNRGSSAARNLGIAESAGEFVAFLDADDYWHPRKIELQEAALRVRPDAAGCYTRCAAGVGLFSFGPYPPPDVTEDEFLLVLWYNNFFPPSAVMIRREALARVGGFNESIGRGEDIELWFRLVETGPLIQVPESLCYYRVHPQQKTTNAFQKIWDGKVTRSTILARYGDRLVKAGLERQRLWDSHRNDILLVYYRRDFASARRLLWDYWREHPADWRILCYWMVSHLPRSVVERLRGRLPATNGAPGQGSWAEVLTGLRRSQALKGNS